MEKAWATFLTVVLCLAVLLPVHEEFRGPRGDDFPLSWYPMFSRPRPDPEWSHYVVGRTDDGQRVIIPSWYYVKGSMNQARRQLDHLVRQPRTARETCERAARRVARSKRGNMSTVQILRVVRGYFHMEEYFSKGNKEPVREITYARCRVVRDLEPSKEEG